MYNVSIIRPDPAEINKGRRMKIHIPMVMNEIEVELVRAKHDLDYQCVYVFYYYIYQNNWILIVVVIFQFV
jgi:hypothetical protein